MRRRLAFECRLAFKVSFIILLLIPLWGLKAQTAHKPAEFIVQTVLTKAKENDTLKKSRLAFERVYTVENLNSRGEVTDKEKEEVTVVELGVERPLQKNGRPAGRNSKVSTPKFDMMSALEAMIKFDDFEIVKIEMLDNRPYYLISFKARSERPRADNDVEEVIVRSEGWMYVDIEKFYIRQLTAWMTRPYSRALGIFSLKQANFEMFQEEFQGVAVMRSITIIDRYSVFGVDTFEKQTYSYRGYQVIESREQF